MLLEEVGVERAHGFATHVSSFQLDAAELDYAETLDELVSGTQHRVVDRGRDGSGPP